MLNKWKSMKPWVMIVAGATIMAILFPCGATAAGGFHCKSLEKCKEVIINHFASYVRDPSMRVILVQKFSYVGEGNAYVPHIYKETLLQEGQPGAQVVVITEEGIIPNKRFLEDKKFLSFFVNNRALKNPHFPNFS